MPAIASLEDLKFAQKPLRYALCAMLEGGGVVLVGKMCVESPWGRIEPFKGRVGATSRPEANGLLCRGKLWLEERTPEQLKGEGE